MDILKESHAHLAEAKSDSPNQHPCSSKALHTGKSWDDIWDILHLKLCNVNIHTYTSCFMEMQQRDSETLAAYAPCFKMGAKRCGFNSGTTAIHIFVKGLWDAHNIAAKVYEKEPQTLSEVIKLLEKFKMAQQVTATLSPPMMSMMSNDDRCFACGRKGHIGHNCPNAKCYNCNGFGHFTKTAQRKSPHQEHLTTTIDHAPIHIMITTTERDHNFSITDAAKEIASTGHDHTINLNVTEAVVTIEDMHPVLYPVITAAYNTHPSTDVLRHTPTGTPYTITAKTHP